MINQFITLQFSFVLLVKNVLYYIFDIHGEVKFFSFVKSMRHTFSLLIFSTT